MSLRNILAAIRRLGRHDLDAAMTVETRPRALVHKDFREFTAPARSQRGSALQIGAPRHRQLTTGGIIPGMGGNVP